MPKKASKTPSSIPGSSASSIKSRTSQPSRLRPKSQFGIASSTTNGGTASRLPTNGSATLESPSSRIRPPAPFQKKSIQVPKSKSELGNKPVTKLAFVSTSKATTSQSESTKMDSKAVEMKPPPHPQPPPLPPTPQEATKNVVKLINAAEKAPPIPAKSHTTNTSSQLPPKHSKIIVPKQPLASTESANEKKELPSADRIDKPPTPPERTTSSSSMKDIEMTVEDLVIEVPQEKEVTPAEIKVIDVHESSKIEHVEAKSDKSEKKSKLGSKLSKLSKMSPKFGRKHIEVAKSFISSSKTSLSEEFTFTTGQQFSKSFSGSPEVGSKSARRSSSSNILEEKSPEKTSKESKSEKSEMEKAKSKIEKLFSPKLKNRKSMSPLKSRSVSPTSADVKNPQFLESSIIDEEIEEDSEIRMIVDLESGVSKIGTIELKKSGSKAINQSAASTQQPSLQSVDQEPKVQTRPSSLLLDKNRNPSLSSRVSIIDLVNEEIISSPTEIKSCDFESKIILESTIPETIIETVSPYDNSLPPTPPLSVGCAERLAAEERSADIDNDEPMSEGIEEVSRPTTSSSSNLSECNSNFVKKDIPIENKGIPDDVQDKDSTADDTISQISLLQDSIQRIQSNNPSIIRTKSYEILKEESDAVTPPRVRPHSLYCSTNIRTTNDKTNEEGCSSPEESDPTLNEVKKIMKRSDILQKLNGYDG